MKLLVSEPVGLVASLQLAPGLKLLVCEPELVAPNLQVQSLKLPASSWLQASNCQSPIRRIGSQPPAGSRLETASLRACRIGSSKLAGSKPEAVAAGLKLLGLKLLVSDPVELVASLQLAPGLKLLVSKPVGLVAPILQVQSLKLPASSWLQA